MSNLARRIVENPRLAAHRGARKLNQSVYKRFIRPRIQGKGIDVPAADWDTLIILDACRFDVFEDKHDLPGELHSRISKAASTKEFLFSNFQDERLHDTVYVTANPQLHSFRDQLNCEFHSVVDLSVEGWDDGVHTVRPERVTNAAKSALNEFSNKRIIIHYLQPHYPFLGPTGDRYFSLDDFTIWRDFVAGNLGVSKDIVWQAYLENVDIAIEAAGEVLEMADGKTVVTSDHGQLFGERAFPLPIKEWGHPDGIYLDTVLSVPWLEYTNGARRDIVMEPPIDNGSNDGGEDLEMKLRHLGYIE